MLKTYVLTAYCNLAQSNGLNGPQLRALHCPRVAGPVLHHSTYFRLDLPSLSTSLAVEIMSESNRFSKIK
ncbi:LOW QUALITY PROTEIN: hypothetical protein YC2023_038842 [Brassica napus]